MKKISSLLVLALMTSLAACSGEAKQETTTTETTTTEVNTDSATADAVVTTPGDSVHHAHLHESKGMVHNHEHGHPADDTTHRND